MSEKRNEIEYEGELIRTKSVWVEKETILQKESIIESQSILSVYGISGYESYTDDVRIRAASSFRPPKCSSIYK